MTSSIVQGECYKFTPNTNLKYKIQMANLQVIQQHRHCRRSNQSKNRHRRNDQAHIHSRSDQAHIEIANGQVNPVIHPIEEAQVHI
jgi:hypothetical protein